MPDRKPSRVLVPGETLGDFYRIEGSMSGGMGIIYLVKDWRFDRRLVLKTVKPDVTIDSDAIPRFHREAEAWLTLQPHDHVVELITIDRIDHVVHILSEFVEGGTLEEWFATAPSLPIRLRAALEIARGMAHIHSTGLLHRDLKPANIFMTRDMHAKVGDFGLARPLGSVDQLKKFGDTGDGGGDSITVKGSVVGTPSYMAPEMWFEGAKIGSPADIYAYGVLLFELLLGRKPFVLDMSLPVQARYEKMRKSHVSDKPAIPENNSLPADVRALILDCLAKQPGFRPLSFDLIALRLEQVMPASKSPGTRVIPRPVRPPAELHFYRGLAWSTLGNLPRAIEEYSFAIRSDPKLAEAYVNRGRAYRSMNQLQEAHDDLSRSIQIRPDFALAYTRRGDVRYAAGDSAGAEEDYATALRLRPQDPETLLNRAALRLQMGDHRTAASDLDTIILARPDHAPAFNSRGLARQKAGDFTGAFEDFNEALKINPAYAVAAYNRACARAERQEIAAAIEDFGLVILLEPGDFMARYNRASLRYESDDIAGAREDYERCREMNRSHGPTRLGLALCLMQLGDKANAADEFRVFLRLCPDHELADEARTRLAECEKP